MKSLLMCTCAFEPTATDSETVHAPRVRPTANSSQADPNQVFILSMVYDAITARFHGPQLNKKLRSFSPDAESGTPVFLPFRCGGRFIAGLRLPDTIMPFGYRHSGGRRGINTLAIFTANRTHMVARST